MSAVIAKFEGNLVADPETFFTQDGAQKTSFRVACSERVRRGDTWEDGPTTYLTVVTWRELATTTSESLRKGMSVVVEGKLTQRTYERRDGNGQGTVLEVLAQSVGVSLRFQQTKDVQRVRANGEVATPRPQQQAPAAAPARQSAPAAGGSMLDNAPF